jgi:hypothetical protein
MRNIKTISTKITWMMTIKLKMILMMTNANKKTGSISR